MPRVPICANASRRTSDGPRQKSPWRPRRRACASPYWWCTTRTTTSRRSHRARRSPRQFRRRRCGVRRVWGTAARYATPALSSGWWNSCAPNDRRALEAGAKESFRTCALEIEQERLVVVVHVEIDAQPGVADTERQVRAPAELHFGMRILVFAIGGVVADQFQLVVANVERPAPRDAPGDEGSAGREDAGFGVFLVLQRAGFTALGPEIENVGAEPEAPFDPVVLD